MKILILSMLALTMAFISNAQNVSIPDTNFKSALVSEGVDTNTDGEISYAEAEFVTSLYVNGKNITDMTGIEAFINLVTLICDYNQLTSLDVSGCIGLTLLECGGNQLTSLGVSNNTALNSLFCQNNQLTSLDVSGCIGLTLLECGGNQLTSLDVSGSNALYYLRCYNNILTSLDVSNNAALIYLYCSENQLTSLDVSNNTALASLECSGNQLTSLDLSKNKKLLEFGHFYPVILNISNMPTLYKVCVWEMPFPPVGLDGQVFTTGSPNVYFTTNCLTTDLNANLENGNISVYPNPVQDVLQIDLAGNAGMLEIFNISGKSVHLKEISENNTTIDVSGLENGIYFVKVTSENQMFTGKFVKQ